MSSYGSRLIEVRDDRVPSGSDINIFMLLPTDSSPLFSEDHRNWERGFLTGTETYIMDPIAFNGPPDLSHGPEQVDLPVGHRIQLPALELTRQYNRVFVKTICREPTGTLKKDYYDDLTNYQKGLLRQTYDLARTKYEQSRPQNVPINRWDFEHSKAYRTAFTDAEEMFHESLSGITVIPEVKTATDIIGAVTQPDYLKAPSFNWHEILPVSLCDGKSGFTTRTITSLAAIGAPADAISIEDFGIPTAVEGGNEEHNVPVSALWYSQLR